MSSRRLDPTLPARRQNGPASPQIAMHIIIPSDMATITITA
ncbi:hypothetical protein [Alloacidobacterium sp.]|nr:hypothetical protein [Alloacidobacterium sp.]HYK38063.1 hypothetical protein [Alloacidobacterium sp.]